MNKIQEFFNEKFGTVRTIIIDGATYFIGIDIAKALGYSNVAKAVSTHCKRPIKIEINVSSQNGKSHKARNTQEMFVICKSDIYRLIIKSKLESSDEFESWIFDEIMPAIEKTGAYIEEGREEEMVNYYFSGLSTELQCQIVNELIAKNKELQGFYDDLMNTEGLMSVNTVAKELGIGEYKLFSFLRDNKVFFYNSDRINVPYQRFCEEGKFVIKETPCHDGEIRSVTYVTRKGLDFIRKLLRKTGRCKIAVPEI